MAETDMEALLDPTSRRRFDSGANLIEWVVPRLRGDDQEVEQSLEVIMGHMEQRYLDGLADALYLADLVQKDFPSRQGGAIGDAIRELIKRNHVEGDGLFVTERKPTPSATNQPDIS